MDEEQSNRTFNNTQELEFDENSKDMDIEYTWDKSPSPSDDYE